jgi:hypothetical protein
MPKRRPKQAIQPTDAMARLRKALAQRTKRELIDALVEFAEDDRRLLRRLDARFELEAPPRELVAATRQAIADATYFDKRDINRNFHYDYAAYEALNRNLRRLIGLGQLRLALELSLELMVKGSHQIEMSDEGLMTAAVKECLQAVLEALPKCDLPPDEVAAWCTHMLAADRVGFVCDEELKSLRCQFEGSQQ